MKAQSDNLPAVLRDEVPKLAMAFKTDNGMTTGDESGKPHQQEPGEACG
jgi:hypothetical protein